LYCPQHLFLNPLRANACINKYPICYNSLREKKQSIERIERIDMRTANIAPTWMGLARIAIDEISRSDLALKKFTIALLEDACGTLDELNDEVPTSNTSKRILPA